MVPILVRMMLGLSLQGIGTTTFGYCAPFDLIHPRLHANCRGLDDDIRSPHMLNQDHPLLQILGL
jgi:hypothetical protein